MASVKKTTKTAGAGKKPRGAAAAGAKPTTGVDDPDALMATTLRAMEWASKNKKQIAYGVVALAVAAAGVFGWFYWRGTRDEQASELVAKGVAAELAPIREGNEDQDTLKRIQFFGSEDEKQKAALADYAEARAKYGDTGPGILARLGEAGVHLDRHEWDEAITAYNDVRNSSLGAADVHIRMSCIEGLGYAHEGKNQIDEARRSFDELSNLDVAGAKPLGLYHLARLDMIDPKGKDAALNKLKSAHDYLQNNPLVSAHYLKEQVEKLMTKIDPASVPKTPSMPPGMGGFPGGGPPEGVSPEQWQKLLESLQSGQGGGGGAVPPQPINPAPAPKGS